MKFKISKVRIAVLIGIELVLVIAFTSQAQIPDPDHLACVSNGAFNNGASLEIVSSISVQGNYAYVTSETTNSLEIIDISNSTKPTLVKSISRDQGFFLSSPRSVKVRDSYAYVASWGDNALEIIDVSNPAAPVRAGRLVNGDDGAKLYKPYEIIIDGQQAFIKTVNSLEVVDISDPHHPKHAWSIGSGTGSYPILETIILGNYLYHYEGGGFGIYDISNHSYQFVGGIGVSSVVGGTTLPGMAIAGNFAYLTAMGGQGIIAVDISDPTNPFVAGTLKDGDSGAIFKQCRSLIAHGDYLYVGNTGIYPVEIVDISNPAVPKHAGNFPFTGTSYEFNVTGNHLYLGTPGALVIVNIEDPLHTVYEGQIDNSTNGIDFSGGIQHVMVSGHFAYLSTFEGFTMLDISNPAAPILAGSIVGGVADPTPVRAFVSNNVAYLDDFTNVSIFDISNKTLPRFLSTYSYNHLGESTNHNYHPFMEVRGKYLYWLSNIGSYLDVIDISDPSKPQHHSSLDLKFESTASLAIQGNYLYAATDNMVKVIDISGSSPRQVAFLEHDRWLEEYLNIFVSGHYVYAASRNYLDIIDVSNPVAPVLTSATEMPLSPNRNSLCVLGNYAYLTKGQSIIILDVSDPSAPELVKTMVNGYRGMELSSPESLTISAGYLFVANSFLFEIINLNVPVTAVSENMIYSALELYPNPADNKITVVPPEANNGPVTIRICSVYGQCLQKMQGNAEHLKSIDVSTYANGCYLLIVEQNHKRYQSMFIKQ